MPLTIVPANTAPAALLDRPEGYLVFYSDVEDGRMWCGASTCFPGHLGDLMLMRPSMQDCRAVDDVVQKTFSAPDGPSAAIVWRAPSNVFRGEPFKLTVVPTIVKIDRQEKKEIGRLVDQDEVIPRLESFVR
ncbi:unnamed protein product [Mycena citricolor]|uniref:Thioredoxin domain-containing protein n=1 Tax=Mycena citricolor TaxID=2018698 RepID=A0AAD2K607_9AGAR|nr:unnamed protein product [Mycena citricolor]